MEFFWCVGDGLEVIEERVVVAGFVVDSVAVFAEDLDSFGGSYPVAVAAPCVQFVVGAVGWPSVGPDECRVDRDVALPVATECPGCGRPQLRCLSPLSFSGNEARQFG